MARMMVPRNKNSVARTPIGVLRTEYNNLADEYNNIVEGEKLLCPKCGEWKRQTAFYQDSRFATNRFYLCSECVLDMATDYDKKTKVRTDNREKTIKVMELLDLPFIDTMYQAALRANDEDTGERHRASAFQSILIQLKTLPQYRGLHWKNSNFVVDETKQSEEDSPTNRQIRKKTRVLFGEGFTDEDYWYLQTQYDDWCSRVQVDTKSQEIYVTQICMALLDILKGRQAGEDVTKKLSSLDSLMNAANLQPKQNVNNASTDTLTFGQMLEKWEEHDPLPEPDPELRDVDGMTKYIHTWLGWILKALGIKNAYSQEYEEEVQKYTVTKPEPIEEGNSQEIYDTVFGSEE